MDLQISVFLLFLLFTAGHSLKCFECSGLKDSCADQTLHTCTDGSSWCYSQTIAVTVTQVGDITSKSMSKGCISDCLSGSLNHGYIRNNVSCCNTDLCNLPDLPDPDPNGKKCYTCDGKSCSKTLSCLGEEYHCFTGIRNLGGPLTVAKGCVSKSLCDATSSDYGSISCCEGNLCNGAQSVTQSFLFLCCSLLSYFLLH